jgi:nucleoid-associated protein YgaU
MSTTPDTNKSCHSPFARTFAAGQRRHLLAGSLALAGAALAFPSAGQDALSSSDAAAQAVLPVQAAEDARRAFDTLAALQARQKGMEQEAERLQQVLREKELEAAELRGQLSRLERVNADLGNARGALADKNARCAADLAQARQGAELAQQALRERAESEQQRQAEQEQLGSRFAELEALRDQALTANLGLQEDKRKLIAEIEAQRQTLAESRLQLESLQAKLSATQTELQVVADAKMGLESELMQTREHKDAIGQDLAAAQEAQGQAMAENERLQAAVADLQTQLGAKSGEVEQAQAKLAGLTTEYQTLQNLQTQALSAAEEGNKRIASLEARVAELERANQALTSERDELAGRLTAAETASAELENSRVEVQTALDASEARAVDLQARIERQEQAHAAALAAAAEAKAKLEAEKSDLISELTSARQEAEDLTQKHKVLQETHAGAVAAVERLQKDKSDLQASLEAEQKKAADLDTRLGAAMKQAADLEQGLRETEERAASDAQALQSQLARAEQAAADERGKLQAQLTAREGEVGDLQARLQQAESGLTELRGKLPASEGGTVSDEQVQVAAAEYLQSLRDLHYKRGEMDKAAWNEERSRLEHALRDKQYLLAQSMSARSVYPVQRNDTLAKISREVYGDGNRWPEIFEANRHLLENPDRVFPGMTLVIP